LKKFRMNCEKDVHFIQLHRFIRMMKLGTELISSGVKKTFASNCIIQR